MKKLLLLAVTSIALFSCSKDVKQVPEEPIESQPKYAVSFNVSDFMQITGPITSGSTKSENAAVRAAAIAVPLSQVVNHLYYLVYDNTGKLVSRLEQHTNQAGVLTRVTPASKVVVSNSSAYGNITDSLAVGTYTVIMAGAIGELTFYSDNDPGSTPFTARTLSTAEFTPTLKTVTPTFYAKSTLVVTGTMEPQNIAMNRIVGQLMLNIEDAIPAEAAYYDFVVAPESLYYRVNLNQPDNAAPSTQTGITGGQFAATDKGRTNFGYGVNILNTTQPITATIVVYDAQRKVINSKTVNNISVKVNQKTTLTGKMFQKQAAFTVGINPDWGSNTTTVPY